MSHLVPHKHTLCATFGLLPGNKVPEWTEVTVTSLNWTLTFTGEGVTARTDQSAVVFYYLF